jgi:regulator of cell morphogenesis and NO signaling
MINLENLTIAEIVAAHPSAAALLEKHHIDFCCKGKMKLASQVEDHSKLELITSELQHIIEEPALNEGIAYDNLTLTQLVDLIVNTYHKEAKEGMPVIFQHLLKVAYKHGENFPYMIRVASVFEELMREMDQHMLKEELILFPAIKSLEFHSEKMIPLSEPFNLFDKLEDEHENAGRMMDEIRELTNNFTIPESACMTFRVSLEELKMFEADLHLHVFLENHFLFPKALRLKKNLFKSLG